MHSEMGEEVQEEYNEEVTTMHYNSLTFDLNLLDKVKMEKKENELNFLDAMRKTMKKVRSIDTLNFSNNHVLIHFKEKVDLDVLVKKSESHQVTIESATVRVCLLDDGIVNSFVSLFPEGYRLFHSEK